MTVNEKLDLEREIQFLNREKEVEDIMTGIGFPAFFNIDPIGLSLIRVFIYPENKKEFSAEEVRSLRLLIEKAFSFSNKPGWDSKDKYGRKLFMWVREVRDNGNFFWWRQVKHYPEIDLMFFIENAPIGKCKLVQKEKTVKYFEADCSEEPEESNA